jgi:uncharacterized protein (DUF1697 family)
MAPVAAYVALLRGINVGGKNKLPMLELARLFEEAGATDVRTYIQSGNVIFRAPEKVAPRLPSAVSQQISTRFGLRVPVVLRSAEELRLVPERNPFLKRGADPDALHVMFLADRPEPARVLALDAKRSPPDELAVREREIYLRLPNGVARSKLTNDYFDRALATTSTGRNWRTVLKLIELAGG